MKTDIETVPGHASPVWGGFVWIDGEGQVQHWSKRATQGECERIVMATVDRLGLDGAFAP